VPARAADFLRRWLGASRPRFAVVLGSGLGGVAAGIEDARTIPMAEIPGFPAPTVLGHAGRVRVGHWGEESVLILEGRTHLYEGHSLEYVTRAVRILSLLGIPNLVLTNAAGSCHHGVPPGSLMRACDLVDLFFRRMRGDRPDEDLGADARVIFDAGLGRALDEAARRAGIELRRGVLGGFFGPAYETAAEVRLLRRFGVDAACMSTIPEALAARRWGIRVAAVSLITNYATGAGGGARLEHADVVAQAAVAAERLERLLRELVSGASD
jgi:inosine/guanosine/xanthosine phosphorylase family protein